MKLDNYFSARTSLSLASVFLQIRKICIAACERQNDIDPEFNGQVYTNAIPVPSNTVAPPFVPFFGVRVDFNVYASEEAKNTPNIQPIESRQIFIKIEQTEYPTNDQVNALIATEVIK